MFTYGLCLRSLAAYVRFQPEGNSGIRHEGSGRQLSQPPLKGGLLSFISPIIRRPSSRSSLALPGDMSPKDWTSSKWSSSFHRQLEKSGLMTMSSCWSQVSNPMAVRVVGFSRFTYQQMSSHHSSLQIKCTLWLTSGKISRSKWLNESNCCGAQSGSSSPRELT